MDKPSQAILDKLSKPFKNEKFNLLERTKEALAGMKLSFDTEERPKLLDAYVDADFDLASPQLITLENDCVYIVRSIQATLRDPDISWRAETSYLVFSTVSYPGTFENPPDYDDFTHYNGPSEIDALMAAIKVILLERYVNKMIDAVEAALEVRRENQ